MANGMVVFDPATADKILEATQSVLGQRIVQRQDLSVDVNPTPYRHDIPQIVIIAIGAAISGKPGKYNGTAYYILIDPTATYGLTLAHLKDSANTGTPCRVWNISEANGATNWISESPQCLALGMWAGIEPDGTDIYVVEVTAPPITDTSKNQVLRFNKTTGKVEWRATGGCAS